MTNLYISTNVIHSDVARNPRETHRQYTELLSVYSLLDTHSPFFFFFFFFFVYEMIFWSRYILCILYYYSCCIIRASPIELKLIVRNWNVVGVFLFFPPGPKPNLALVDSFGSWNTYKCVKIKYIQSPGSCSCRRHALIPQMALALARQYCLNFQKHHHSCDMWWRMAIKSILYSIEILLEEDSEIDSFPLIDSFKKFNDSWKLTRQISIQANAEDVI